MSTLAQGAELCFAILGSSPARTPLIAKMRATTLRDAIVVGELIALPTTVSSTVERVLECSPCEASRVEVMGMLGTKFQGLKETCSQLEGPSEKVYSLLLGPSSSQAH
jgi:hypothetical protein